jgi:hypothetical protein
MLKSDTVILSEGMNALKDKLGILDSEKFISIILKERFDYTEWQRTLWAEKSLKEIHEEAKKFYNKRK